MAALVAAGMSGIVHRRALPEPALVWQGRGGGGGARVLPTWVRRGVASTVVAIGGWRWVRQV